MVGRVFLWVLGSLFFSLKSMGHSCSMAKTSVHDWEEKDTEAIIGVPFNGANPKDGADHS